LTASGNGRTLKQDIYVDVATIFGVSKQRINDDDTYSALITADPSDQIDLLFGIGSYSGSAGEVASCQIRLTYYATMFERNDVPQS